MKSPTNQPVVILFGPPGAGKGTQAELISDKFGLSYIETSKIIESEIMHASEETIVAVERQTYRLKDEINTWRTGGLVSTPLVLFWMQKKIREIAKAGKGLLLAGSPRTVEEGETLMPLLVELYGKEHIHIIHLQLSQEQSIWRNSHRRICELMRHPVLYTDETKTLTKCPLDGSPLVRREGLDDPETIRIRLKEYDQKTKPLIGFFSQQGFVVHYINGEQNVAQVFADILSVL